MTDYHDCVITLQRKQLDAKSDHLVLGKDYLVVDELFDPAGHGLLDLRQAKIIYLILHKSISFL